MKLRFLHFADCHLGYWQYNHRERYNDFGRAFLDVVEVARREQVAFVLLAGDLFHKRAIEALTLNQAMSGLERLKAAGIPCIAVQGNHELAYHGERMGWVEMLATRQLLILLDPEKFENGIPQLSPYTNRKGSYFDPAPGLRVHGLRYTGSGAAKAVEGYAQALAQLPNEGIQYTIFVTHAGVEGVLPEMGGLSHRQWAPLRPYVDYVALGHIHKPFAFDDWIYNPGSTETCATNEASWEERGYFLVEVDTEQPAGQAKHQVTLLANARRCFERLSVKCDLLMHPDALIGHCRELLERKARDFRTRYPQRQQPVVELVLHGVLPFDRTALDLKALEQVVIDCYNPLLPLVKNHTQGNDRIIENSEGLSRSELEQRVLNGLLQKDSRFQAQSERWADLARTLKALALDDASPEVIADELATRLDSLANV